MRSLTKLLGIITLAAVIGFVLAGCEQPTTHTHQWGAWAQTTAPNCTTAGEETRTCTIDPTHKEIRPVAIDPNAHNWQPAPSATAPTCTEDGHGDQICAYNTAHTQSGTIPKLGHDFQNYSQTTAPTCTTEGVETGTCTRDAATTTRSIAALGHDYQWVATTPATCTTAGVETGTCIRDQATTTRSVAALGHNYGNWTVTKAPTLTEDGEEEGVCSHFGETVTRPILSITAYLNAQTGGDSANDPIPLPIQINLSDNGWQNLLDIIAEANKYVSLDLSDSTGMIEFDPGIANTGEKTIVSLVLPDTATSIAFIDWSNPTFRYFTALKKVTGFNVTSIGDNAFSGLSNISEVNFPAVIGIGSNAFQNCSGLIEIDFPLLTSIASGSFDGCTNLTEVTFSASVSFTYNNPFIRCVKLTKFNLTGTGNLSVIENGKALVRNNTEIIAYPSATGDIGMNTITSIGKYAFCFTNITKANFPSVTNISDGGLAYCLVLTEANFPMASTIGGSAFFDNRNLTEITISASASLGDASFGHCNKLINFNLNGTGDLSVIENGKALVRNNTELVSYPSASNSIVMNSITNVSGYAFYGCGDLTEVSLPIASSIGYSAFERCYTLNKITLGTIIEYEFNTSSGISGNLRDVYFGAGGGAGTYTTTNPGNNAVWTKQ
jgi:hypothetical protein